MSKKGESMTSAQPSRSVMGILNPTSHPTAGHPTSLKQRNSDPTLLSDGSQDYDQGSMTENTAPDSVHSQLATNFSKTAPLSSSSSSTSSSTSLSHTTSISSSLSASASQAGAGYVPFSKSMGRAGPMELDENAEVTSVLDPEHEVKKAIEHTKHDGTDWLADVR